MSLQHLQHLQHADGDLQPGATVPTAGKWLDSHERGLAPHVLMLRTMKRSILVMGFGVLLGLTGCGGDEDEATVGAATAEVVSGPLSASCTPTECDRDGDCHRATGACGGDDCNDSDSTIHPGAIDYCVDNIDQNCSGAPDEGCMDGRCYQPSCRGW